MPNVGLVFSARDNVSGTMAKIRSSCQYFNKDLDGLQQRLDHFNKTKVDIKMDMSKAKNELKSLQKEFHKTGDAATGEKLKEALLDYEKMSQNLKMVEKAASQTRNEMVKLGDEVSRTSNRTGGIGGTGGSGQGMLSKIASAGATQMLGDLAGKAIGTYISSAMGSAAGQMTNSILSYGASGAAIGSMIAPGIGTAIGAAAGGIAGAVSGAMDIYAEQDEAFKSVVQNRYDTALQSTNRSLENGSAIASGREMTQISFSTLFKDEDRAKSYLEEVKQMANYTPFQFEDLTAMSKILSTYKYDVDDLIHQMTVIGDAGAALGSSTQDMNMVATGLGRMRSSGKVTLEYINLLQERGIDALGYLAQGYNMTEGEVYDNISAGLFKGAEAAKCISEYMEKAYQGAMKLQSEAYEGLSSTITGLENDLDNAMGKAYTDTRKKDMKEQVEFLGGEDGEALKKMYSEIGTFEAEAENKKNQIYRDVMGSVARGEFTTNLMGTDYTQEVREQVADIIQEYQKAKEEGDEAAAYIALNRTKAFADSLYAGSEEYQAIKDSNIELAKGIREDTVLHDEFWNAGYQMGQQFSKGMSAAIQSQKLDAVGISGTNQWYFANNPNMANYVTNGKLNSVSGKAFGLPYVPYDNYPALLHQGERVLTASEARGYQNTPNVNISGNFTVREEADIGKIAKAFVHEIMLANMVS